MGLSSLTFTLHQNRKGIFLLNMGLITLIQGFKLSVAKFDEFLAANGLGPIEGYQPLPDEAVDIAKLFTAKGVDCEVKNFRAVCDWIQPVAVSIRLLRLDPCARRERD